MFEELYETESTAKPATTVATTKPADIAPQDVDLEAIALAHFAGSRTAAAHAQATLFGVIHDLSTATKLAEAKSLRERLINAPLAEARKVSKSLKSKLTAVSKAVGTELDSIESGFAGADALITPQIEERDAQLAAERAEREAKEAARVAAHRANIDKLASYATQAHGKTSAQILTIINGVSGIEIIPEQWEEFAAGAEIQKEQTLEALQALFDATKTAEDEAAAREAQRIENERAAAALAEERRQIEAERAELKRQADELAAAKKAEADRIEAAAQAQRDAEAKAVKPADVQILAVIDDPRVFQSGKTIDQMIADGEAHEIELAPLDVIANAEPADVIAPVPDDPLGALHDIADALPTEEPAHTLVAVSPGVLHPSPEPAGIDEVMAQPWTVGGVTFGGDEPAEPDQLAALLAHIDEAFAGKFPSHPKPSPEWWGTLRRLTDEAREFVAA